LFFKVFIFIVVLVISGSANAISLEHLDSDVEFKREQLTEVQFDNYLLNLKGTKVNWRGKVLQVKRIRSEKIKPDKYRIYTSPGYGFVFIRFHIFGKQHALILNKNQVIDKGII
jgi:hypothetical protein